MKPARVHIAASGYGVQFRATLASVLLLFLAANAVAMPRAFPKKAGGPSVTFETGRVRATGAAPGATIYFASVSLYTADEMLHVVKPCGMVVADANGNAELLTEVHTRSVWLVVDATKGYTVAAPRGMLLREMDIPKHDEQENDANGELRHLVLRRFSVDVYLIRPGKGLWTAYYRDGGDLDEDRDPNGKNKAVFDDLLAVGATTGKAGHFKPHDYLFFVDRNSLEFHVARRGAE